MDDSGLLLYLLIIGLIVYVGIIKPFRSKKPTTCTPTPTPTKPVRKPNKSSLKNHCVYIIRLKGDLTLHKGYVGVTSNFERRRQQHASQLKDGTHVNYKLRNVFASSKEDMQIEILFDGLTRDEAYDKEFSLRPSWNIGWNIVPGGEEGKHYTYKRK